MPARSYASSDALQQGPYVKSHAAFSFPTRNGSAITGNACFFFKVSYPQIVNLVGANINPPLPIRTHMASRRPGRRRLRRAHSRRRRRWSRCPLIGSRSMRACRRIGPKEGKQNTNTPARCRRSLQRGRRPGRSAAARARRRNGSKEDRQTFSFARPRALQCACQILRFIRCPAAGPLRQVARRLQFSNPQRKRHHR